MQKIVFLSLFFLSIFIPRFVFANPSVSPPSCSIPAGSNGCYSDIATYWSDEAGYLLNIDGARVLAIPPPSGNGYVGNYWFPYGQHTLVMFIYGSGAVIHVLEPFVGCAGGLVWNGSVCAVPPVNGVCAPLTPTEDAPTNGCAPGTMTSATYNPVTGRWNWICLGQNGGASSGTCSSNAKPKISFGVGPTGSGPFPDEYTFNENASAYFHWNVSQSNTCFVTSGKNALNIFQSSYSSDTSGYQTQTVASEPYTVPDGVFGVYTITCTGPSGESSWKNATVKGRCAPREGAWNACHPLCDQDETGDQEFIGGRDKDCNDIRDSRQCRVPKCQPDGFSEVAP